MKLPQGEHVEKIVELPKGVAVEVEKIGDVPPVEGKC